MIRKSVIKMLCGIIVLFASMNFAQPLSYLTAYAAEYDAETIASVQNALNNQGYECGTADGVAGNKTKEAIRQYQEENGLDASGEIDDELLSSLGISNTENVENPEELVEDTQNSQNAANDVMTAIEENSKFNIVETSSAKMATVKDIGEDGDKNYMSGMFEDDDAWNGQSLFGQIEIIQGPYDDPNLTAFEFYFVYTGTKLQTINQLSITTTDKDNISVDETYTFDIYNTINDGDYLGFYIMFDDTTRKIIDNYLADSSIKFDCVLIGNDGNDQNEYKCYFNDRKNALSMAYKAYVNAGGFNQESLEATAQRGNPYTYESYDEAAAFADTVMGFLFGEQEEK